MPTRWPWSSTGRPGLPTTVEFLGTSLTTTLPAPILALSPTVTAPSTLAPAPNTTLSPTVGCRLPVCLPVPPRVTPWYMVMLSPISVVSPITTPEPWSMNRPWPILAPGWISMPVSYTHLRAHETRHDIV